MTLKFVKVPKGLEAVFQKAEELVSAYFDKGKYEPSKGMIEVFDERYVLVRAAALSIEFFEMMKRLLGKGREVEAREMALNILFDLSHAIGRSDAKRFSDRMNLQEHLQKLSAGPVHFSRTGWAFVDILPESTPSPDKDYCLIYDHTYSFESDAWMRSGVASDFPVCVMNSGYSSGWCEESFGLGLVASEILCRAKGDDCCRFIMAPPDRIAERIAEYAASNPELAARVASYEKRDFFERSKRAETDLKASEARNRALLDTIPDLMFLQDWNGVYLDYHVADPSVLLVSPEKFLGSRMEDVLPADLAAKFMSNIEILRAEDGVRTLEYPLTIRGESKFFEARMVRCSDVGVLTIIRDITKRRYLEEALVRSENKYRTLITDAGDAILVVDTDGTILEANRAASMTLDYPLDEITGTNFLRLHAEAEVEAARTYFGMAVEGRSFAPYDSLLVRKDGLFVPTSISLSAIEYDDRTVVQCFIRDITERKRVERIKDNIVRDLAHKLKTPLAMAQMSFDSLKDALEDEDADLKVRSLRMMENSVIKLRADVDRILDYFQFTMRKGTPPTGMIDIRKVAEAVIQHERLIAEHKPLEFVLDIGEGASEILIDERDLQALLDNMVGNAVKFTKEGKITLSTELEGDSVKISVTDTGIGMTSDVKDRVFERFFQGNSAYPGVGLGLAMCKEVVARYGGSISVSSPGPNQGATVTAQIPKE